MKKSSLLIAAAVMAVTAFGAQAATPAAPAPAPAATTPPPPPPTFGTSGQCVLDVNAAMQNSKLGQAAGARMEQLAGVVKSELDPKGAALQKDLDALKAAQTAASAANATPAAKSAADAKLKTVGPEYDAFQQLTSQRKQELQYTQQQVLGWIFDQMVGPINQVVTARGCSMVITADSLLHVTTSDSTGQNQSEVLYANTSLNITNDVVAKLDAANIQLPQFDRADLSQQQGGQ